MLGSAAAARGAKGSGRSRREEGRGRGSVRESAEGPSKRRTSAIQELVP